MLWLLFVYVVLDAGVAETPGRGADKCSVLSNRDATEQSVLCKVRTLDSGGFNVATVPSEVTSKLYIECNNVLLFESSMQELYFHRFLKLAELSISNCKLLRIPRNSFEGLRELRQLTIRTRNFDWSPSKSLELNIGAFNGLRELHTLDLAFNNMKVIPLEVFCVLENLHELNLTYNRLKTVDRLGFGQSCGSNVQSLDLSHNELKTLPEASDMTRLKRLQNLYLQHNNITYTSGEALNGLTSLRIVNISYNRIQTLPEGMFASTRELREIHLNNNALVELAKGIFHRLEQLLVLDVSSNQLTSNHIDENTFSGLIRLVVLNLSHNALTRIDGKTFKDLFFLQNLNMRNNSIGFIEENAFLPLYNLHTLNLAENRLHTIDEHLFNGLFVLSKLTLNNNLLVNIDTRAFTNCSDIKELDLSSNQITKVPQAVWKLNFLKTLDLGENQISEFQNGSFQNLGQLTGLRLIDNKIGNLTEGMLWDLTSLQVLNLAKNKIHSIERGTFTRNTQLEAIRLDGNFLSDINGVFSTLASLLWLNLSENHLVWFDYAFLPSKLKWLDLHGNFIEHLGNYYKIQHEINVKTLDVSHNRITEISPMAIPNSVELLFINNNLINSVQINTFTDKTNLSRVDMYANEIVKMDLNSLRLSPVPGNRSLPEFYIGGNPIDCDCTMAWLPIINNMTSMRQHPRFMDLENVICKITHTRSVTHIPLTSAKPKDFMCKYETHCFPLCHCCDFDACDCEMTCPQNCTCYHDPMWNTNVVDCSAQRVNEIPNRIPMDATHVYLDGNDLKELQNHAFIGRKNMQALYANSSAIEFIQNRTFAGLAALRELHLEDNKLTELHGFEFDQLSNLKELHLQNNLITYIVNTTFMSLRSLEILRLDGNRIIDYSIWNLNHNRKLNMLSIGDNPWSCKCRYLQELSVYLTDNSLKVVDITKLWCWNKDIDPPQKKELNLNGTACSDYYVGSSVIDHALDSNYLPMMVSTFTGILLILLVLIVLFLFRDTFRVWLYTTFGIRVFSFVGAFEDADKIYDAYVCYSPKDEDFVVQILAGELENGHPSYHMCLHHRDIPNGAYNQCSSPLLDAAEASKKVVMVLTKNFLQTEWSRFEFRQALHEALKSRIYKLIIIEEHTVLNDALRDPDLRPYLKTGVRIKWGQHRFWERLRYELPDSRHCGFKPKSHISRRTLNTYTLDSSVPNTNHRTVPNAGKSLSEPPEYCSRVVGPLHTQLAVYGPDGRPLSDHIYTSIDSDYSSLDRAGRRQNPRHWPAPPVIECGIQQVEGHAYQV